MNKDTLLLKTPKFKNLQKDRLFYDQFEYCIAFYLDEVTCLRYLDHAKIDDMIERRKQWREIAQQRWVNGRQKYGIILSRTWREITDKTKSNLHSLAQVLLNTDCKFKLVTSVNQGYIYTNDVELINVLDSMHELSCKTFSRATVSRPKNTIKLKKVKHAFRTYFKALQISAEQKDHLMDFLYNQRDHVRVSSALQRWIDQPFTRTQDYFFVDHDLATWTTMLSLVHPGLVRKTMHIIPDK